MIDIISTQSLLLKLLYDEMELASGTGFIVVNKNKYYLITAKHNLTGRHFESGKCLHDYQGVPNKIKIYHHAKKQLGLFHEILYPLYKDEETPLWIEDDEADVAILSITENHLIDLYPYDLTLERIISIQPSDICLL